jgi:hypothetical protein
VNNPVGPNFSHIPSPLSYYRRWRRDRQERAQLKKDPFHKWAHLALQDEVQVEFASIWGGTSLELAASAMVKPVGQYMQQQEQGNFEGLAPDVGQYQKQLVSVMEFYGLSIQHLPQVVQMSFMLIDATKRETDHE